VPRLNGFSQPDTDAYASRDVAMPGRSSPSQLLKVSLDFRNKEIGEEVMLKRISFMLAALVAAGSSGLVRAEVASKGELPSRVELHAIPTL
jgi:hypothetical protein